jgi:glycosyltransferase involved in cell wall biosynthesis
MTMPSQEHGGGSGAPLVSLVMPAWNPDPRWLQQAVAAALDQRGCSVELVVVDDGSDAPVAEQLAHIADDRLRVVRIPHGRVSRARNAALEIARGDFVRFIDCDDIIRPESTAHLLSLAGDERVVAYGATLVCDEELRPLASIGSSLQGDVTESCLLNRFSTTIHSLLFPRALLDEIGPWEPSIVVSQDWDYALRAFERATVRGDRRVVTHYRTHVGMNSRNVEEGIRGYRLVVDRYFQRNPHRRGTRLHRRALALYHLFAAVQLATARGRYRSSLRHFARALSLDPVTAVGAIPRQGAMPLMPTARRLRAVLPRRRSRRR